MQEQDRMFSANARGQKFLKRGGGVGGGNVPSLDYGSRKHDRKSIRSSSDQTRGAKKGIRELIVDHLKN